MKSWLKILMGLSMLNFAQAAGATPEPLVRRVKLACWRILNPGKARENFRSYLEAQRRFTELSQRLIAEKDGDFELRQESEGQTVLRWPSKKVELRLTRSNGLESPPQLEARLLYPSFPEARQSFALGVPPGEARGYDHHCLDPKAQKCMPANLDLDLHSFHTFLFGPLADWIHEAKWQILTRSLALEPQLSGAQFFHLALATPAGVDRTRPAFLIEGHPFLREVFALGKRSLLLERDGDRVDVTNFSRESPVAQRVAFSLEEVLLTSSGYEVLLDCALLENGWSAHESAVNIPQFHAPPVPGRIKKTAPWPQTVPSGLAYWWEGERHPGFHQDGLAGEL